MKEDEKGGFQLLPSDLQVIAASTLRGRIEANDERAVKEPVEKLAREVKEAFIALYFPSESSSVQNDSDQAKW